MRCSSERLNKEHLKKETSNSDSGFYKTSFKQFLIRICTPEELQLRISKYKFLKIHNFPDVFFC